MCAGGLSAGRMTRKKKQVPPVFASHSPDDSDPKDVPAFFNGALMREIMPATTGHEALMPSPGVSLPPLSTTKA